MTAEAGLLAESRAILIGVSDYEDTGFPPIRAARNSLRAMRALLEEPGLCGWPRERITEIANPVSARQLADQVADLAEETTGILLLYYVGHGVLTDYGDLCLTVSSTRRHRPKISGLPWDTLAEILRGTCPARARLVILDSCFSGRAIETMLTAHGDSGLADITHIKGVYTLTATTSNRTAHVPPPGQQDTARTSFTGELCDLVRSGIPGKPAYLTFTDIYPELRKRLIAKGLPTPNQRATDTASLYPFAANVAARGEPGQDPSRTAPRATRQEEYAQASRRTGSAHSAAGQEPPVTANQVRFAQTPAEADAVRKDIDWFESHTMYSPNYSADKLKRQLAALEEMGGRRAALRINGMNLSTAESILNEMHPGPAAVTLGETVSSRALEIASRMNAERAATVLALMEPERALDLLIHMPTIRAADIVGQMSDEIAAAALIRMTNIQAVQIVGVMAPAKAAAVLARIEPVRILELLTHVEGPQAAAIMSSMHPVAVASVLAVDRDRASLLLGQMEPSGAGIALARMEPTRALDLLTRVTAARAGEIIGRMSDDSAAVLLGKMPADHAGAMLELLGPEKTVAVLEAMAIPEARTVLGALQPFTAQQAMALMSEEMLLAVIGHMDPRIYEAIRVATHPEGAFDVTRAQRLRPWKFGTVTAAVAMTLTTTVLFWAIIVPQWHGLGPVSWSLLLWLPGLTALGFALFVANTDTDKQTPLLVSAAGFSLTAAGLALSVEHVLTVFFVPFSLVAMTVSCLVIVGGGFMSSEKQEKRAITKLPGLPISPQSAKDIIR